MRYVKLGKTGLEVSAIALGFWAFGGGDYWADSYSEQAALRTTDAALDAGVNFFDTAESYNDGQSDAVLGRVMKGRRQRFIVSTKIYLDKLREKDVIRVCEESLKRMDTDYIDLMSPHFASRDIPFEETFGALARLKEQGKIRALGLSNFGVESLERVDALGLTGQVAIHQLPYSLLWRAIEYGILQKTAAYGIGVICYSTLAQGLLGGQYNSAADVPDHLKVLRFFDKNNGRGTQEAVFTAIARLKKLCAANGLELAPAALAWLFRQPGVTNILTGATDPGILHENLKCLEADLPGGLAREMSEVTEPVKEKLGDNPDMWMADADSRFF